MKHFNKKIYKLLEKHGIRSCSRKEPTFIEEDIPPFIEELLLHFEWPEERRFTIKHTKGFWFTDEKDEPSMPYEFLGENSQKYEGYFSLASDQNFEICLDPQEKEITDPTLYLIDMEEVMLQQYRKENPSSVLAKNVYIYEFETFKLSWFLKRLKYYIED